MTSKKRVVKVFQYPQALQHPRIQTNDMFAKAGQEKEYQKDKDTKKNSKNQKIQKKKLHRFCGKTTMSKNILCTALCNNSSINKSLI